MRPNSRTSSIAIDHLTFGRRKAEPGSSVIESKTNEGFNGRFAEHRLAGLRAARPVEAQARTTGCRRQSLLLPSDSRQDSEGRDVLYGRPEDIRSRAARFVL